ncbi:hypothetical protein GCM10009119_00490 [Algoriphagus jejuensis]|uniref:Phosphate-selective porin OprO/OprP n=1 Tax=Algoriphagus jejuensis TaxID=419934 RepID=A0ABN1MUQ8_9BACT
MLLANFDLLAQTTPQLKKTSEAVDSVLVRNVQLLSLEDTVNLRVSLIILDKKLELVTRDDIKSAPGAKVYDGKGGFLMGRVAIGEAPSFVVLKENPRENFDIFLNTKDYVIFAMEEGLIVTNILSQVKLETEEEAVAEEEETKEREQSRRFAWTSYNPPPMAVPFNYYSSRKWNRFETKYISGLFNGIIALDRMNWLSQNENSRTQVGELENSSLGEIRAIRFGLIGTLNFKRPWVYTVFVTNNTFDRDYTDDGNKMTLYDLRLDIPLPSGVTLSVGKQKEPISMSRLTTLVFLPMQERQAAEDAFLPARNWGTVLNGSYLKGRGTWAAGLFKNFVDSDTSFRDTPIQLTGRVTAIPFLTDDQSNLLHIGLGLRYSDAKQPVVAKTESEFYLSPIFVQTPQMNVDNFFTKDFELYWRKGPVLVGGEYITNRINAPDLGDPTMYGFNVGGTWAVTGEMRPYRKRSGIFDPLPVSKPVGQGGTGALELAVRYSLIDLNETEVQGGQMRTTSAGLTWWPSPRVQVGANYRFVTLDRDEIVGKSSGMNVRLMLILD